MASQQCLGVTAGQARYNSSNVGGVTAGQVRHISSVCNAQCTSINNWAIFFNDYDYPPPPENAAEMVWICFGRS